MLDYIPTYSEALEIAASRGQASANPDLWDELVGYWPMLEGGGGTVHDLSGFAHQGTHTGTPSHIPSPHGLALRYDGSSEGTTIQAGLLNGNTKFTLAMLVRNRGSGDSADVLFEHSANYNSSIGSWLISIDNQSNLISVFRRTAAFYNGGNLAFPSDTWIDVVITFDEVSSGVAEKVYYNGIEQSVTPVYTSSTVGLQVPTQSSYIASRAGSSFWGPFDVSNVRCCGRVLSPLEVVHLYRDPWALLRPAEPSFLLSSGVPAAADHNSLPLLGVG